MNMNENYIQNENQNPEEFSPIDISQSEILSIPTQEEAMSDVSRETDIDELPEVHFEEISPEDFESALEIAADVERMNTLANHEGATTGVRANAIANALLAGSPEEQEQIAEAQKIVAESTGESGLVEWVGKHGRKAMASLALIVGLGGMAQNAQAGGFDNIFKSFGDPTIQKTVNKIGEGFNTSNRLAEIDRREQSLRDQIESLESRKQLTIQQAEANQDIKSIQVNVDSRVQPLELEAKYKEQRAQLGVKKEESKKQFLALINPTSSDLARYEATQSRLNAEMARIDGQNQLNTAKTQGRLGEQSAKIGENSANANRQIHNIEMQQARLAEQIRNLNLQRLQVLQRAGQVISR